MFYTFVKNAPKGQLNVEQVTLVKDCILTF